MWNKIKNFFRKTPRRQTQTGGDNSVQIQAGGNLYHTGGYIRRGPDTDWQILGYVESGDFIITHPAAEVFRILPATPDNDPLVQSNDDDSEISDSDCGCGGDCFTSASLSDSTPPDQNTERDS